MVTPNFAQHFEYLRGELARRRDDESSESVVFGPSRAVQFLENGDDEC